MHREWQKGVSVRKEERMHLLQLLCVLRMSSNSLKEGLKSTK